VRFSVEAESSSQTDSGNGSDTEHTVATGSLHNTADRGGEADASPSSAKPILAEGHTKEQQAVIDAAWELSNGDIRFIYLLTAENGQYTHDRIHPKVAGSIGTDYGLCGVNDYYHRNLVSNPRFKSDWKWQLKKCYELYRDGTTFYGIIRYDQSPSYRQKIHAKFL
jgi:hypothetical protein